MRTAIVIYWLIAIVIFFLLGTNLQSGILLLLGYVALESFAWIYPYFVGRQRKKLNL
jgi:hypothetical protein